MITENDFYNIANNALEFEVNETETRWEVKMFGYVAVWSKTLSLAQVLEEASILFNGLLAALAVTFREHVTEYLEESKTSELH